MRYLAIAFLFACTGCCKGSDSSGAAPNASTSSSTIPTAKPSTSTATTASASPSTAGLAALFAGAPDEKVKLSSAVPSKMANLMIQSPAGWTLVTEQDLGWQLITPDHKIQLQLSEVKPGAAVQVPHDGVFIGYTLKNVKANPMVTGTVGKFALPAQVIEATALIDGQKENGKVYAFLVQTGGKKDVEGIAMVRAGATAQQHDGLVAAIRSLRRATDK